ERGLVDEPDPELAGDLLESRGHFERVIAALERARARDQREWQPIAEARFADGDDRIGRGLDIHRWRPCAGRLWGSTERVPAVPAAAEIATGLELKMTAPLRAASTDFLVEHQRCADGGFRRDNRCAHARGSRDPARLQRRTQSGAVAHTKLYGGKPCPMGNIG